MKKAALAALLLVVLVPLQARAFDTKELLGLVAMPLAVAAASDVTGVPVSDLSHFVATLNRAQVPPTQIVQVVRYAPAALVIEDQQPTFVQYVDTQFDQGVTGPQLVTVIEDRYRTYDLEPQLLTFEEPATTYVVRQDYIPDVVVTRVAQVRPAYVVGDTNDLLALAAMPLAVAAVADITGIPLNDLGSFVASLNAARVPPMQVVEVLRYSPVVLVNDVERPGFVQFVNTQVVDGVTGLRLVDVIDNRLRTFDVTPVFNDVQAVNLVDDDSFFPPVVTTRVAEVRAHPHGGPPGQLKKSLGLQTGAEVVHGTRPGSVSVSRDGRVTGTTRVDRVKPKRVTASRRPAKSERRVVAPRPKTRVRELKRVEPPRAQRPNVQPQPQHVAQPQPARVHPGKGGGAVQGSGGGGKGQGQGQGQGKGKGKGKG